MRYLGLLGGMTYHSTVDYYMGINDAVAAALGGHASAPLLLDSLNFQAVRELQIADDYEAAGELLATHARRLEAAGAEGIVICTNLMHKVAPAVEAAVGIPLLHIADAVAAEARERSLATLGLMGAGVTMQQQFYADRLHDDGVEWVQASDDDIALTDRIVFDELTKGIITDASRAELLGVVGRLAEAGADGVVLGCTEIPLILSQKDSAVPLIDSAQAHIRACVEFVLG